MDLNDVVVFVKVVQSGSFTKAARLLSMPNSTVSSKVSSLERSLGVTLLKRTTRQLNLTDQGRTFFEAARRNIDELETAATHISQAQSEPQGTLKITAPTVLGTYLLPPIITAYLKKFPKVRVQILLDDKKVDLIKEGIDVAIRAGALESSSLIQKKIGQTYFGLYASANYLKANPPISHPKDLHSHRCLVFSSLGTDAWSLENTIKQRVKVSLSDRIVTNDLNITKELATQNLGIALLPTFLCEKSSKDLERVLPNWKSEMRPLHFVYSAEKFGSIKLSSFIEVALKMIDKFLN